MRTALILVLLVVLAGCGSGDDEAPRQAAGTTAAQPTTSEDAPAPAPGVQIVAKDSEFGSVLFDESNQAIYVFEIDRTDQSNCTSAECVEAWPPVVTDGEPSAGPGVDASLLGTIERDDGTQQVTYNGRPLYFYGHEGPGEIKCHNVDLHGGLWWVVTPEGEPAA